MAKKIKDENGNTYKLKKPFYKRVWFWILVIIIVVIAAGSAMSANKGSDDKSSSTKTTATSTNGTKSSSSNKSDNGKITRAQFDAVKIGDLMNKADGGQTTDEIKKTFGKPSSTSSSTIQGVKTDILTWTNVEGGLGANIIISFTDGKAFSKNLAGFKINRKNKISLADFESIANGTSYNDVIAKFGEPDSLDESLIGGTKKVIAMYMTGIKGDLGANFNITFDNDAVSGKSQSDMK